MKLWHTFYLTSEENNFSGPATSPIVDSHGTLIKMVPHSFAADLFIEGSGILSDGRVLNVAGNNCGREAFDIAGYRGTPCYHVLSARFPWGSASNGRPLVPLRTLAVDRDLIPLGTDVYLQQFDGLQIPAVDSVHGTVGGFVHDGWFKADDRGGGIHGPHIDIFAGPRSMYRLMERIFPTSWRSATQSGVGAGFDATVGRGLAANPSGVTTSPGIVTGIVLVAMAGAAWWWLERRTK